MNTVPGSELKVGDGKCWKHKGKFLGKVLSVEYQGRSYDPDPVYIFEKGTVNGDISSYHNAKFTEVGCDGKPLNTKPAAQPQPKPSPRNANAKVGDGKCYQHNGKYLGALKDLGVVGRDSMLVYIFEKGKVYSDDLSNAKKLEVVSCKNQSAGTRRNRRNRKRQTRRKI